LGHFALTGQLLDLLKKGAPSRIINVSSIAHRQAKWNVDDIPPKEKNYSAWTVYANTKISNLLFTYELERRLRANKVEGVIAVASHPGVSSTNLFDSTVRDRNIFLRFAKRIFDWIPFAQSPEEGSLPTLYAATVENVEGAEYYGPKDNKENMWGKPCLQKSIDLSYDEEIAKKLWQVSEELTKINFKF
jgi:NAD(P)-dependent dehydrogenase (short-subunit alcohol dehydrogenase family)